MSEILQVNRPGDGWDPFAEDPPTEAEVAYLRGYKAGVHDAELSISAVLQRDGYALKAAQVFGGNSETRQLTAGRLAELNSIETLRELEAANLDAMTGG